MSVETAGESKENILNCYCTTGVWADSARVAYNATGTSGTNKVYINTVTGEWSVDILETGNGPSGVFADFSGFKLGFRCEPYLDPEKFPSYISNVTVTDLGVVPNTYYTKENGWTLNGSEEQEDGSLAIKAGGNTPTVFRPELEYGKKYSITYDVTGLETDGNNSWAYPFRVKLSAGGEDVDGALAYRMGGRWSYGDSDALVAMGTNGSNEIIYDTVSGEWQTGALGSAGRSGKFADPSDFAINFYRWSALCQSYISNVTVTDITPVIYNSTNGWSLGVGAKEMGDGSLKLAKANYSWFTPTLESGKAYEISYDVDVTVGGDGIWAKPFQMSVATDGENEEDILNCYCTTGVWADSARVAYGATGTSGTNKVYINTETGEWSVDILGTGNGPSGTLGDLSGFKLGFRCEPYSDPETFPSYISNVTLTDLGAVPTRYYTKAKGWTLNGSEEQEDGSLAIKAGGDNPTVFSPRLEYGKKYSIKYDVTGLTTDSSNSWAYPFRIKVSAGGEDVDGALAYRMVGRWNYGNSDALVAMGTNGTNEIIYDTVTGEWETYALGSVGASGTFADPSGFAIKFYRWASACQVYISNVTVTEVDPSGGDKLTPVLLSYDLTSNDAQINTPDGLSSFNANLHFEANYDMNANVSAFAAVYDAAGNIVGIGMVQTAIGGTDVDVTVPVTLSAPYSDTENNLKIFIWDGALSMRPYHEVVSY